MATVPQKNRQQRALQQLKTQIESGVKTKKGTYDEKVPLTKDDKERLNREIENLKNKL